MKLALTGGVATANAIKATIPRRRAQGSIGETDMHGAQQHVPLMTIMIHLPDRGGKPIIPEPRHSGSAAH